MTDEEFQKKYNYSLVRVDKKDDLRWAKAVIYQLVVEMKITPQEHKLAFGSLVK